MIFMSLPSIRDPDLMTQVIGFESWLDLSSIYFIFNFIIRQ
jgi:hypothetical protein